MLPVIRRRNPEADKNIACKYTKKHYDSTGFYTHIKCYVSGGFHR